MSQRNYSGSFEWSNLACRCLSLPVTGHRVYVWYTSHIFILVFSNLESGSCNFLRSSCTLSFRPSLLQAAVEGNVRFLYSSSIWAFTSKNVILVLEVIRHSYLTRNFRYFFMGLSREALFWCIYMCALAAYRIFDSNWYVSWNHSVHAEYSSRVDSNPAVWSGAQGLNLDSKIGYASRDLFIVFSSRLVNARIICRKEQQPLSPTFFQIPCSVTLPFQST